MKKYLTIFLVLLFSLLHGEDLELTDGRTLKDYRVLNHNAVDAMVIHEGGAENISFELFPKELQEKYEYDSKKAKSQLKKQDERVKETRVELGDYTDKKLNDAFTDFAKENKTTPILSLVTNGSAGKAIFFQKCVYDREKKILILLKRAIYQTIPNPTTSYSWVVWRGVEPADLSEGIPWFSERLKAELSKSTEDGRTNLPVQYPNEPTILKWP